jgi:hypothetical protein
VESRATTYAGRRRAGGAPENGSEPKQEPIASRRRGAERMAARMPFRPSQPSRPRRANQDPDRLLRWILAAVVVIGLGTACAVIIALVIMFG